MIQYPFTTVLEIMKPCKIDSRKASHVKKLDAAMRSTDYSFEEKIDGISILSIGGRLFSNVLAKATNLPSEKTNHVPHISLPLAQLSDKLILDGELYYPGKKSNHVTSISNADVPKAIERQNTGWIHRLGDPDTLPQFVYRKGGSTYKHGFLRYVIYDILRDLDGTWLTNLPFTERRTRLEQIYTHHLTDIDEIDLNTIHHDNFQQRLDEILESGGEGAVLKSKDGIYVPGKRPMWNQIKLKQELTDDVVIIGFEPATKPYTGSNVENWPYWADGEPVTENYYRGLIGSIMIGKYDSMGNLVQLGTLTGLTDELRRDMTANQSTYIGTVIKIKAMERSEHGVYRHANFVAMHPDKNARECRLDEND